MKNTERRLPVWRSAAAVALATTAFVLLPAAGYAGFGNLIKQAAKQAAVDKAKEEAGKAIVKAVLGDPAKEELSYEEAQAEAMSLSFAPDEISSGSLDEKDFGATKPLSKLRKQSDGKVAVVGFRVAFMTSNAASASDNKALSNLGNSSGSGLRTIYQDETVKMQLLLQGIEFSQMQAITDAAYVDFMERLQSSGLEVIPADDILARPEFQEIEGAEGTAAEPYKKGAMFARPQDVFVFSPSGMPLWFGHWDTGSWGDKGPMERATWKSLNALSAETGAMLLCPQITLNFAHVDSSGQGTMFKDASVKAENTLHLVSGHTYLYAGWAKARIAGPFTMAALKKPHDIPGKFAVNALIDERNNASWVNGISRMTGQPGRITRAETYAVVANPTAYQSLAEAAARTANAAFVAMVNGD